MKREKEGDRERKEDKNDDVGGGRTEFPSSGRVERTQLHRCNRSPHRSFASRRSRAGVVSHRSSFIFAVKRAVRVSDEKRKENASAADSREPCRCFARRKHGMTGKAEVEGGGEVNDKRNTPDEQEEKAINFKRETIRKRRESRTLMARRFYFRRVRPGDLPFPRGNVKRCCSHRRILH